MDKDEGLKLIDFYCRDEMRELKKVCNQIISRKVVGTLYYDDLYDDAMNVLLESVDTYDKNKGASFSSYLIGNIRKSFFDWTRDQMRWKRCNLLADENGKLIKDETGRVIPVGNVSLDAPSEDGVDMCERIGSNTNIENEVLLYELDEGTKEYLETLNPTQKEIARLIMNGYEPEEIRVELNISEKEYQQYFSGMKAYEKKRILFKETTNMEENEMETMRTTNDIAESYKNTSYSVQSISKQLKKNKIRDNHILQRHSGQWKSFAKSELVSDILRGKSLTQIIISEEFRDGISWQWLIDGKQRCTTLDDYYNNGFAISKNVKNYIIQYQTPRHDEDGNPVLTEEGFAVMDIAECDIRGKKFSQLPEELQEIFADRQIPVLYNMRCTKKDIADDIARFNRSRPMNIAQHGWLGLEEEFAELAANIAKMPFFQTDFVGSTYTENNYTSGNIRRIVVEAIMVSDFIDEYNRDFNKMCEFLSEEASDNNFTELYGLIERLTNVANKTVAKAFNAKDSFLWFALFSRFVALGIEDSRFIEFLADFTSSEKLQNEKVDGVSYFDLCFNKEAQSKKATKDKSIVVSKMNVLESVMKRYFGIEEEGVQENTIEDISETENEIVEESVLTEQIKSASIVEIEEEQRQVDTLSFIRENVNPDITQNDLDDYIDDFDILSLDIRYDSKLLNDENKPSMLAIVAYSYTEDLIIDEWLKLYAEKNNTYFVDQKRNYLHMKDSLDKYIRVAS